MYKSLLSAFCTVCLFAFSSAHAVDLRDDAPKRYTVKKGDTLWKISKQYLRQPWHWPKLWGFNKTQIKNPHRIYPGQVLVLYYVNGEPRLGIEGGENDIPVIKLSPYAKNMSAGYSIPTLPLSLIKSFMDYPQIIPKAESKHAPQIIKGPDNKTLFMINDRVYAKGIEQEGRYLSYRINQDIYDPQTKQYLGQEIIYSGELATLSPRNKKILTTTKEKQYLEKDEHNIEYHPAVKVPAKKATPLTIVNSVSEIQKGDYLRFIPSDSNDRFNFVPHAPEERIQARVIRILNSPTNSESGQYQTVLLNKGTKNGVNKGTILNLYQIDKQGWVDLKDVNSKDIKGKHKYYDIPAEELGYAMVYNTTETTAYAIILEAWKGVSVGDIASNPGQDLDVILDPKVHVPNKK